MEFLYLKRNLWGFLVTNKFGAAGDYTYYGISVPFLQKSYEHIGRGVWTTPNIKGITDALENIHNNNIENKKQYAIDKMERLMSSKTVSNKFLQIFNEKFIPKITSEKSLVSVIKLNTSKNNFTINDCEIVKN